MKIQFGIPGEMSLKDATSFTKRIKETFSVEVLCNVSRVGFNEATVHGMTAEGSIAAIERFAASELKHVNWLRIS